MKKIIYKICLFAALLVSLTACSPLKIINTLSANSETKIVKDIDYGVCTRCKLDIYIPHNAKAAPVIVFFYGGSWNSGSRTDYSFVGHALASRGFVAVIADYRLYPEVRYPLFLDDSAQAVSWTFNKIADYGGDPKKLFVMGHSAGAYNAAMIAVDDRWLAKEELKPAILRGWIGLAGPYNFLPIVNPDVRPVFFHPNTPLDSQPINHVSKQTSPGLLIAARDDSLVDPIKNTTDMSKKMKENGVSVTEIYYDDVSHITLIASLAKPLRFLAPTLDAIENFVLVNSKQ